MKSHSLRLFHRDTGGNVLILAGLGILFLVGIGGAGYDLGRQQLVRQKIQQATDAAALAAASMDFGTPDNVRQNTAQAFFSLNYPQNYLGVARPTPTASIAGETITVSAGTTVPTSFVGNFGVSTIAAAGRSRVQFKRLQTVIDVILVMDNSGSMGAPVSSTGGGLVGATVWMGVAIGRSNPFI
jgi:Flp pilus assembly protein TadG